MIATRRPATTPLSVSVRLRAGRHTAGHAAALGLFLLLAVFWLRPLPWRMADHVTGPGDPLTTAWRLAWPAQWLTQHPAPFWETNVLYPAARTFARDELTLGDSLFAGPIYALTGNALFAYNLTLLITLALSGFAMYCLAWHLVRSRAAGVVAGMVYALAPYHLAQLDHAGLLAVQWLPLIVLFLDRTLRAWRWRDAAIFGAMVVVQALSAGYYAYWSAIVIAIYMGYVAFARRSRLSWRALRQIGTALAAVFVALLPVIVPFTRVAVRDGFARPLREVEYWSARPQTWLAATPSNLVYGATVRGHAWTWSAEMYLFPGVIALALSVVGFFSARRLRWWALMLAFAGFVLTLGPYLHLARRDAGRLPLPYLLLYRFVPGGDALRAPVRAAPIAMLGIALLAAVGWSRAAAWMRRRTRRRHAPVLTAIALCAALAGEYAVAPLHTVAVPQLGARPGSLAAWLRAQPPSVVVVLPDPRAPVATARATADRHRFVNGDAEILPPATRALFRSLDAFPSLETIGALEAIGVELVALDRTAAGPASGRLTDAARAFPADLSPVAELDDATVYRLAPPRTRFGDLLDAVSPMESVCVAGVPADDPTYLDRATLAHLLRVRRVRGDLRTGWTSEPTPLAPGERCDNVLLPVAATPSVDFSSEPPVWSDGVLALYRARQLGRQVALNAVSQGQQGFQPASPAPQRASS